MDVLHSHRGFTAAARTVPLDLWTAPAASLLCWTFLVLCLTIASVRPASAQNAQLSGFVRDAQNSIVVGARVSLTNAERGTTYVVTTNDHGLYAIGSIRPGPYELAVDAPGFAREVRSGLIFEVSSAVTLNITVVVGRRAETVAVTAEAPILSTRDGSRGTVVEREFIANMPLSGRTMHSLIALAPGVVNAPTSAGAFNVNGQRASANYMTVDGVAANLGVSTGTLRDSAAGQSMNSTLTGGMNGIASLDSIQEFRIQTSTFAPEYGRTPGAQISLVTRSGTSSVHFSLLEQFRSEALDATNWFVNNRGLAKPELSQHSFGGTVGGPLMRNTFFFAAYEGLKLTQPTTILGSVPSLEVRQQGPPEARAFLSAFPAPTGPAAANGLADFAANSSDRTTNHAPSLRLDRSFGSATQLFVRYAHARSRALSNTLVREQSTKLSLNNTTLGVTHVLGSRSLIDVRVNYGSNVIDSHGVSLVPTPFLPVVPASRYLTLYTLSGTVTPLTQQNGDVDSSQRQFNVVASASRVAGGHNLKAGVDYRRLAPEANREDYRLQVTFASVAAVLNNTATLSTVNRYLPVSTTFHNVSLYLQDTWRPTARVSATYGVRWDLNPAPTFGPPGGPLASENLTVPQSFAFDPQRGKPLWRTGRGDVAPRAGLSFALDDNARHVLAGGIGLFYDIIQAAAGDGLVLSYFPNTSTLTSFNVRVPLTDADLVGPPAPQLTPPYVGTVGMVDPDLRAPRSLQWNGSYEWSMSTSQALSVAYVASRGSRLLGNSLYSQPNASFPGFVSATYSAGKSRYNSLQLQYRHRASSVRTLASYTLSASDDTGSATSAARLDEFAPSDFDVRHNIALAISLDTPQRRGSLTWLTNDWGLDILGRWRSALPVTITTGLMLPGTLGNVPQRPDRVQGVAPYISDPTAPEGRRFNPAAFIAPPSNRQGTEERNSMRGYRGRQLDLAIRRTIRVSGSGQIQLRVDAYNVFNLPNFGTPAGVLVSPLFGRPFNTLNQVGGATGDQLSPLYQWGGARSMEFSLRVRF